MYDLKITFRRIKSNSSKYFVPVILWVCHCFGCKKKVSLFNCTSRVVWVLSDSTAVCYRGVGGGRRAGHHAGPGQHGHGPACEILDLHLRRHVFLRQLWGNHRHVQDHLHDDVPLVRGAVPGIRSNGCGWGWIAVLMNWLNAELPIVVLFLPLESSWVMIATKTLLCCWFVWISEVCSKMSFAKLASRS